MGRVRVFLIGFNTVTKAGLKTILASDESVELVGEAPDGTQAIRDLKRLSVVESGADVVLTETRTAGVDGLPAAKLIKDTFPDAAVLVLAERFNDSHIVNAIHAGAGGFIFLNEMSEWELLRSIHGVLEDRLQMSASLLRSAVDSLLDNGPRTLAEFTAEAANLTAREIDVLRIMGNGETNKVIAESLNISVDTTKKHIRNIVGKLHARSRTHAAIIAAQTGIASNPVTPAPEQDVDAPVSPVPSLR